MRWSIIVLEPARSWLHSLRRTDRTTLALVTDAIRALSPEGPALGRPLVDTVKGSRLANLKELRPRSRGRWRSWYSSAIPIAEATYAEHLKSVEEETR